MVFTFGRASDAALSIVYCKRRYGENWIKEHFQHLRAKGSYELLGHCDVLRFKEQVDGWLELKGHNILAVRYDKLWDHQATISDFLGFRIQLPVRRSRSSIAQLDHSTVELFRRNYAKLDEEIDVLPDIIVRMDRRSGP